MDVSFEAALADAVQSDRARMQPQLRAAGPHRARARPNEVADFAPSIHSVDTTTMRVDGSNVDPDNEMAQLSANQLAHQTVVSLLDKRFAQFRTAILGR